MGIKFRLTPGLFREMQKSLAHGVAVEQGCFLLCSEAKADGDQILIANELISLEKNDFLIQKFDQLSFAPTTMLRATRAAQAKDTGLCFVHTHPMSVGEVEFSHADDYGNVHTFEFFNRMLPGKVNSALVFSGDMRAVSGRIYSTTLSWERINSVVVVGNPSQLATMSMEVS